MAVFAEVLFDVVTDTSTLPGVSVEGDVTVIDVADTTVTAVPAVPPKLTVAPEMNPVPVMVTEVPPMVVPLVGDSDAMVGATVV